MGTIANNKVYYVEDTDLKSYDLGTEEKATLASEISTSSFVADYVDVTGVATETDDNGKEYVNEYSGSVYVNFFGKYAEATGYTMLVRTDAGESETAPFMIGKFTADDEPSTIESITIETNPTKTAYTVGDKIDLDGIKVTVQHYATKNGKPDDTELEVTEDMISGFDTSKANDSVTVTVKYLKRTATFTISVAEKAKTGCGTIAVTPWLFIGGGMILLLAAGVLLLGKRKAIA